MIFQKERKFELSRIDTDILLNRATREMKQHTAVNPHMTLLDSGSTVNVVRRTSVLSDIRQVKNELLVF